MQEAERMSVEAPVKAVPPAVTAAQTLFELITNSCALEAILLETGDKAERLLGHGPLGSVSHATLNSRSVAVKSLYLHQPLSIAPAADDSSKWSGLISRLQHSHIAPVIALGIPGRADEACLIVEEFHEYGCLRSALAQKPHGLNIPTRIRLLLEVAYGLEHLHHPARGAPLVHRHLSSGNILLAGSVDAPFARISHSAVSALIQYTNDETGWNRRIVGTVGYTCPHYIATGHAQPSLDLYSFGVLIIEMLTRKSVLSWNFLSGKNENSTDDIHLDSFAGSWEQNISRPILALAKDLTCNPPLSRPSVKDNISQLKGILLSMSQITPSSPLSSSSSSSLPNHHHASSSSANNTDEKHMPHGHFQSNRSHIIHSQHYKNTTQSYSASKLPRRESSSTHDATQSNCAESAAQETQNSSLLTGPSGQHRNHAGHSDGLSKSEVGSGVTPDSDINPISDSAQVPTIRYFSIV